MTPGYLQNTPDDTYVIVDEFQTIREYNKQYLENTNNHDKLILMSATPYVPFAGALIKAGCMGSEIKLQSKRVTPRWMIYGSIVANAKKIPNKTVVFSTSRPDMTHQRAPNYVGLRQSI